MHSKTLTKRRRILQALGLSFFQVSLQFLSGWGAGALVRWYWGPGLSLWTQVLAFIGPAIGITVLSMRLTDQIDRWLKGIVPMKLYLDDVRLPPDGWTHARTVAEAKKILIDHEVEEASLDHDLGICPKCTPGELNQPSGITVVPTLERVCAKDCRCDCHETGYDLVKWMAATTIWPKKKPLVHSANPVGKANMKQCIDRYWRPR